MDDTACRQFFEQPLQTYHRQYEALRAIMMEGRSQREAADAFGFSHRTVRQLVYEFRRNLAAGPVTTESPFFAT